MTVLGISAGNGVNLFPFKDLVVGNLELRSDYTIRGEADQFYLNFPQAFFQKRLLSKQELFQMPDIIIGNPKCGNSSKLALSRGKKFKSHKDEPSLDLFIEGVNLYQPKVFMMENLPKLLETYDLQDNNNIFPNYSLQTWIGSMAELGNSQQNRQRLIVTGVHKQYFTFKQRIRLVSQLKKKFRISGRAPKNTSELLIDLPENGSFRPPLSEVIALYGGTKSSYSGIQKLWESLGPTVSRIKTPKESFNTAPGVYRDLNSKLPNTIRKSNRCFNPTGLSYTPRERCRIQGIPDNFLILDDEDYSDKTLFNKGCTTAGSSPSYEVGLWFYEALKRANIITS